MRATNKSESTDDDAGYERIKKKLTRPCARMPINLQSPCDLKKRKEEKKKKMEREKKEKMHARKRACRKYTSLAFLILRGPVSSWRTSLVYEWKKRKITTSREEASIESSLLRDRSSIWKRFGARDFPSGIERGGGGGDYGFDNETRSRN